MCSVLFPLPVDLLTPFQQAAKATKSKSQENKTTRIAQNELLDKIFQCFRQYKYWPFRALKQRLQQPEAYLKQTLEMVAHLIKSGDHSMTWQLKPEAQEENYAASFDDAQAVAPEPENYDDGSEDDPTASGVDEMQF